MEQSADCSWCLFRSFFHPQHCYGAFFSFRIGISKYGLIKEFVVLNIAIRMRVWCHWGLVNRIIMNAESEMNAFFFSNASNKTIWRSKPKKKSLYYPLCRSMALNLFLHEASHPPWAPPNALYISQAQAMCVRIVNYSTQSIDWSQTLHTLILRHLPESNDSQISKWVRCGFSYCSKWFSRFGPETDSNQ